MRVRKINTKKILELLTVGAVFLAPSLASANSYVYTPMEQIPGYGAPTDFYTYVSYLYQFGIGAVGIAALLMLIIGGFMYITSAGNNASMEKAKGVITDAIVGVILALTAYLLLYTINPDLVKIKRLTPAPATAPITSSVGQGSGICQPISSGPCSETNLQKTCFSGKTFQASAICAAESGGTETLASRSDKCTGDGSVVSFGLFQINISANKVAGLNCPSAFTSMYTGRNKNCSVKPDSDSQNLYARCVTAVKIAANNISAACDVYNRQGWNGWGVNTRKPCGF